MVIDKRNKFILKISKNIAKMATEGERMEALAALKDDVRPLVTTTVKAILSGRKGAA